jgi:hypothetical protein
MKLPCTATLLTHGGKSGVSVVMEKMMTIMTALSNSCIMKVHYNPSNGQRGMPYVEMESIPKYTTTDNRERMSVHPP